MVEREEDLLLIRQSPQPVRTFVILAIPATAVLMLLWYGANCFCPELLGAAAGLGLTALLLDLLCPKIEARFHEQGTVEISREVLTPFASRKMSFQRADVSLPEQLQEEGPLKLHTASGSSHRLDSLLANSTEVRAAYESLSQYLSADGLQSPG